MAEEKVMKVWIFEPGPRWDYCGGLGYAIAETYDRAVELLKRQEDMHDHNYYQRAEDIPEDARWDTWVLIREYPLARTSKEDAYTCYQYA